MGAVEKVLDNGLQVIFHKKRQKEVEVKVTVFSGCSDGDNSQMAHFLEHMLFSGSKLFPSFDLMKKELKRLDIGRNGRTSQESTTYFFDFKSKRLPDAMKFIADFMQNPVLNEVDIAREKGILLNEIAQLGQIPGRACYEEIVNIVHGLAGKGYSNNNILSDAITATTREDLIKFHEKHYISNNMLIQIEGNLENPIPEIEKYFSSMKKGEKKVPLIPKMLEVALRKDKKMGLNLAHLNITFLSPPTRDPDSIVLRFIKSQLQDKKTGLMKILREDKGLVYNVNVTHAFGENFSMLLITTDIDKKEAENTINFIINKVSEIENIKEKDLEKLKKKHLKYLNKSVKDNDNWWFQRKLLQIACNMPEPEKQLEQAIKSATTEQIKVVVNKYLKTPIVVVAE
ncbi:MAG: pitrilysin family protein [archaeon]|jgi:predicted Zn-dependent peptidase